MTDEDLGVRYAIENESEKEAKETLYAPEETPEEAPDETGDTSAEVEALDDTDDSAIPGGDGLTNAEIQERDQIVAAQNRLESLAAEFQKKYGSTDPAEIERAIAALREKDPAGYAAWASDYREDSKAIREYGAKVLAARNDFIGRVGSRQREATKARERANLLRECPELKSESEAARFCKHLSRRYTREQIEGALDHRLWVSEYKAFAAGNPPPKTTVRKIKRNSKNNGKADMIQSPGSKFAADWYGTPRKQPKSAHELRRERSRGKRPSWDDTKSILYGDG